MYPPDRGEIPSVSTRNMPPADGIVDMVIGWFGERFVEEFSG